MKNFNGGIMEEDYLFLEEEARYWKELHEEEELREIELNKKDWGK